MNPDENQVAATDTPVAPTKKPVKKAVKKPVKKAEVEPEDVEETDEEDGEDEDEAGVSFDPTTGKKQRAHVAHANIPNTVPVKHETARIAGKDVLLPVHHIVKYPEGIVAYNEHGRRISDLITNGPSDEEKAARAHLAKAVARNNGLRRANALPGDLKSAPPQPR